MEMLSVSRLVRHLIFWNHISERADADDNCTKRLYLTDVGRDSAAEVNSSANDRVAAALENSA
jgi:hypothetical protein